MGTPTKKRILVDVDGVIVSYDFASLTLKYFGVSIDPTEIKAYNLADELGVSSKEIDNMFHDQVWGRPDFIKGSVETMKAWERRYEIIIYSNGVKYMGYEGLARWPIDWGIPFDGIDGGLGEYEYHIDDRPEKLCDTNSKVKLLFTQPWNMRCKNIKTRLKRVDTWEAIREAVC